MEDRIHLQIATGGGPVFDGYVSAVQLPVEDGYMGVMANHAPMLCAVVEGVVKCTRADGQVRFVAITHGLAHVADNRLSVLVNAAEQAENIDLARAQAAERRAREWLKKRTPDTDVVRAEAALHRSLARQMAVRLMRRK
jgi:F-type H+-transporting ATPase subunit epsilon